MPEIGAVILAAGRSSRMEGGNKLLLPWKGKTILETVIGEITSSGVRHFITVVNPVTEKLIRELGLPYVLNPDFEDGMTSSIQKGVEALDSVDAYMICPGDLPLLSSGEYQKVMEAFSKKWQNDPRTIAVPFYHGQKGHPVIFSNMYREAVMNHHEPEGCSGIIKANREHVLQLEMGSDRGSIDIDTRENYLRYLD